MRWVSLDFPCSRDEDHGSVNAKVAMMNTQQSFATFLGSVDPDAVRALPAGHVVALGNGGGQVSILAGRVVTLPKVFQKAAICASLLAASPWNSSSICALSLCLTTEM